MRQPLTKFFTSRDVAERTGVPAITVRHWARHGLITFAIDTNGRRLFDERSIEEVATRRAKRGAGRGRRKKNLDN